MFRPLISPDTNLRRNMMMHPVKSGALKHQWENGRGAMPVCDLADRRIQPVWKRWSICSCLKSCLSHGLRPLIVSIGRMIPINLDSQIWGFQECRQECRDLAWGELWTYRSPFMWLHLHQKHQLSGLSGEGDQHSQHLEGSYNMNVSIRNVLWRRTEGSELEMGEQGPGSSTVW